VRGNAEAFAETFHDNGPTDMVAAMRAYHDIGFAGPMRPDHVPQLDGEEDGEPGYTMMGRLVRLRLHARADASRSIMKPETRMRNDENQAPTDEPFKLHSALSFFHSSTPWKPTRLTAP
jgi:hypothetical protein